MENSEFQKVVTCQNCLKNHEESLYCYWRKKALGKNTNPFTDLKRLLMLLERLNGVSETTPQVKLHIYLLSLLLFRKKRIKLVERTDKNERKMLVFSLPPDERRIYIEEFSFPEEQIEQMTNTFLTFLTEGE
ncbi:MAG: hypothetical protein HY606_13840 [Planctomycetes bacterium]|nr:hypothetical protein [Planctomycetota bacterium]